MGLWLKTETGEVLPVGGGAYMNVTPWTGVTFLNGWSDYGPPWHEVEYRKFGDEVQIRGLASPGTQTDTTPIFNLPAGFRPPTDLIFPAEFDGASGESDFAGRLDVDASGNVKYKTLGGNAGAWVSFNTIRFSVTDTGSYPAYTEVPTVRKMEAQTQSKTLVNSVATFTFTEPFEAAPTVVVTGTNSDIGNIFVSSVSTTGFSVTCPSLFGQTRTFHWIATDEGTGA